VLLLAKIDDPAMRAAYLKDLDVLTRSELERNLKSPKPSPANSDDGGGKIVSAEDSRIADEIQRALGMKVRLSRSSSDSEGGRLTIDFYGDSDLQIIFRKLVSDL
jgi:hypothetical protein